MLPDTEPVIKVARPPVPTLTAPLPLNEMSPPVLVPTFVLLPALSNTALLLVLVVSMRAATEMLLSAAKLTTLLVVLPVRLMGLDTVNVLDAPVMEADTLPVPEMLLAMVVEAERKKFRLALLDSVTAPPVPRVPVMPPLPICKVPPLTVVVPA